MTSSSCHVIQAEMRYPGFFVKLTFSNEQCYDEYKHRCFIFVKSETSCNFDNNMTSFCFFVYLKSISACFYKYLTLFASCLADTLNKQIQQVKKYNINFLAMLFMCLLRKA